MRFNVTQITSLQCFINFVWEKLKLNTKSYTCERCGVTVIVPYGSGRFCSRACANTRKHTDAIKIKISESVKNTQKGHPELQFGNNTIAKHNKTLENYLSNPKLCKQCKKPLSYENRYSSCCSEDCVKMYLSSCGGYRRGSGTGKHGYYKGYYCDSSYELAYVIYNIDHNIPFIRNKNAYPYINSNDELCNYYPDFIEDNKVMVEIKGYLSLDVYRKIAAVHDYPVKLFMCDDIKHMIKYVKDTYNVNDITELYE